MDDNYRLLPQKAQRGSKVRCHLLTHGSKEDVARRLTVLLEPWCRIDPEDHWIPQGFADLTEAQLVKPTGLLDNEQRQSLLSWWLAVHSSRSNTPNWDVASTCTIDGRKGLLLIEAKAHDNELNSEQTGKSIEPPVTMNSRRNHVRIGWCIQDASLALTAETKLLWMLSRDWNYQMSNRFSWAWKLTSLDIPVVLVYLGFLNANEMNDRGKPFTADSDWEQLVKMHSAPLFPEVVWNRQWIINGQPFVPLIKTAAIPLEHTIANQR